MSDPNPPRVPMRRGLRILLVASLALNLAVVGLAVGAAYNWQKGGPPRSLDFAGGPLGQALSREDRREIGQALRRNPDLRLPSRREAAQAMQEVVGLIRAEPFDRDALESVMAGLHDRVLNVRQAASVLIVNRVAEMTPQQRAEFADALERNSREPRRDR